MDEKEVKWRAGEYKVHSEVRAEWWIGFRFCGRERHPGKRNKLRKD